MNINLVIELRILGYFPKKNFFKKSWSSSHLGLNTLEYNYFRV